MKRMLEAWLIALVLLFNVALPAYAQVWPSFRGDDSNMAIVSAQTPTTENVVERWAYKSSKGMYCTPPMLMDDYLVLACGTQLEKVSRLTGELVATGTMQAASSYTQNQAAYGDGRIYFAQGGGRMEAFDAATLASVWKYTNKGGGQDSSPILYNGGYVYTGYWSKDASEFVCINAATGAEVWTKNVPGGFYWAGPVVVGNAVIVGSDSGVVFAWDKLTGEEIATADAGKKICSAMAYDAASGRIYFTTTYEKFADKEACYLCSVAVDATTGAISDLKKVPLAEYGVTNCSCTPVVWGNYVYLTGGNGTTSGYFMVAKADTLEIVNTAKMNCHSKTSPLLSTAYVETDGYLYFYNVGYNKPGSIELTKVLAANPAGEGNISVSTLITPSRQEYAMNSVCCDENGTLYLKNDSGYIFAIEASKAHLTKLDANTGNFDKKLAVSVTALELVTPLNTASVELTMEATDGATISVNGTDLTGGIYTAALVDGKAALTVKVSKGDYSRNYAVNIRTISTDTGLHVATTSGNGISQNHVDIEAYADNIFVVTGATTGTRIWYAPANSLATVSSPTLLRGTSKYATVSNELDGIKYAYRLWNGMTFPLIAKTTVTAENGATRDYYILAVENAAYDGCYALTLDQSHLILARDGSRRLELTAEYLGGTAPAVSWESDNESVATVAADGTVTALGNGTAVITVATGGMTASCTVEVKDSLTVYITYTDGDFVLGKDGTELCNVPVKIATNATGDYTVNDAFVALHRQYCADADGYGTGDWGINKFWGVETGDVSYVLNDSDKAGALILTDTIVEGDRINAFKYQDTDSYVYSDLYTYFDSLTDTATAGTEKTFTVNGYNVMNRIAAVPNKATVTVFNSRGKAVDSLATTVDANGCFKINFASAGTYTVEVGGKADYAGDAWGTHTEYTGATVVPARCTVTVSAAGGTTGGSSGGGGGSSNIFVKFRLIGSSLSAKGVDLSAGVDDAEYVTWIATKTYTLPKGSTTLDLFEKALTDAGLDYKVESTGWLDYVTAPGACGGHQLGDMTNGDRSGWMYTLNGKHSQATLGNETLQNGDSFIVHYVNDYLYEDSQWATGCLGTSAQRDRWLKAKDENPKGSAGSGASSGNTVSATVNPVVVADENGAAKASLTTSELRVIINEAKDAGAGEIVVVPKISGSVDKVTVNIPAISARNIGRDATADLCIKTGLADVTIGAGDLQNMGTNGNLVVTTEKQADGALVISVTVGDKAVKLTDTVVTVAGDGNVLALVGADGTEQVIRKCVADENGVTALINGNCTVKVISVDVAFADIIRHWGRQAAEFVAARGIFDGIGENQFAPDARMNRAMVATVLYRLENEPATVGKLPFKDGIDAWAQDAVIWAAEQEIVGGDENGRFNGSAAVTRQELATMLYRYAKAVGLDTTQGGMAAREFADWEQTADWARGAMQWAVATGLIRGNDDNTINPNGTATRAEVATVLMRLIELGVK